MSSLRKNLRINKQVNAFNDAFDSAVLEELVEKAKRDGEDERDISVAILVPFFNGIYKEYYSKVKLMLETTSLTIGELEEVMIANANRLQLLINERASNSLDTQVAANNGTMIVGNYDNLKMTSDLLSKEIYIGDAVETYIDGINSVISYFQRYDRTLSDAELPEPESINQFMVISLMTNSLAALKSCYDSLVWEEGFVVKDETRFIVKFKDRDFAVNFKVGRFKLENSISTLMIKMMRRIKSSKSFEKSMVDIFRVKRRARVLDRVTVKDGYIEPVVKKGISTSHLFHDLSMNTAVVGYYDFILDTVLPKTKTLKINDIIILFSELRELINATSLLKYDNVGYLTIDAFYDYPFKIRMAKLIEYLQVKTTYSIAEIKSFVELITHESGRIDFWKRPFINRSDDLLFPILPVVGANTLNVVEEWLEAGGFSLDARGELFEKHIKKSVQESMDEKGFQCVIYKNNFLRIGEKFEEIDLLAEFKHCVLIAEVKCIRYPIESRDKYNAKEIVNKGTKQLNRKIAFINTNKKLFSKEVPGLANKPIVKVLITNYPLFSTLVINDVPITDINAIEHYIDEGKIARGYSSVDRLGNNDYSKSTIVEYYTNELEFCENLSKQFVTPVATEDVKSMCVIEEIMLTIDNAPIQVAFEAVKIEQNLHPLA